MRGVGYYFVEADTLSLAYSELYKQKLKDNSLIVHARFNNRFHIHDHTVLENFPKIPRFRVTSAELQERAIAGEVIEYEMPKQVKFANPDLFEFQNE